MKGNIPKGHILVKRTKIESERNGITLAVKQQRIYGEVVICGEEIKKGNTVVYDMRPPLPVRISIHEEEYYLLRESSILYIF